MEKNTEKVEKKRLISSDHWPKASGILYLNKNIENLFWDKKGHYLNKKTKVIGVENQNALVVFQDKKIRRTWHENEWHFSVVDVVEALADSPTPRQYWGKVKEREFEKIQLSPIWVHLKLPSADGKNYETDCANTKNMFRIIQSIPSPKAEPFKRWLAQVGYERVQEIENPELSQTRMKVAQNQKCCFLSS